MNINSYPGFFIDIEGLDGAGASTQIKLVKEALRGEKIKAYTTKEPTDNLIGGLIRGTLTGVYQLPSWALQLLFVADRGHHLKREIMPILKNGHVLLTDRFGWSTVAFGGLNSDRRWLLDLHRYCLFPDISFFLKVSVKTCLKRLKMDRFDFELFEKKDQLEKVWLNYKWLAKKFSQEIIVIEGEKKPRKVRDEILRQIGRHPKFKKLKK